MVGNRFHGPASGSSIMARGCPGSVIHFQGPRATFLLMHPLPVTSWGTFPAFIAASLTVGEVEAPPRAGPVSARLSVVGLVACSGCEFQPG